MKHHFRRLRSRLGSGRGRSRGRSAFSPGTGFLIEGFVAKSIGFGIVSPANVFEVHVVELGHELLRPRIQLHQRPVANAVDAGHLSHQQFAVALDDDLAGAEVASFLQGVNEGAVFGLVVGGGAEAAAALVNDLAIVNKDAAISGGTGIAPGGTVDVDRQRSGQGHDSLLVRRTLRTGTKAIRPESGGIVSLP